MSSEKKYNEAYPTAEEMRQKMKEVFDSVVDWPEMPQKKRNRRKRERQKRKNKPKEEK